MKDYIIQVESLSKSFSSHKALDDCTFSIERGEIFGFLGPSGAGKTTTIKLLSGQLHKDEGNIMVLNDNPFSHEIKQKIGIMSDTSGLYEKMSVYDNLALFADIYGVDHSQVDRVLKEVDLTEHKAKLVGKLSRGQKQRVVFARTIIHSPEILFLDEPTANLDPATAQEVRDIIKLLNKNGTTVFLTTHYMEEVEEIADRIIIMDKGKKIAEGTLKELLEKYKDTLIYTLYLDNVSLDIKDSLLKIEGLETIEIIDNSIKATVSKNNDTLDKILLFLVQHNYHIRKMETEEGNLEMVFLELTGKKLRD
ncbi:MAG: ABC transporter ATP-binding protein [Coprobacillus sp.]